MIVFVDFEASSLAKQSYPIEIAWVFADGRSRSFLIKPDPKWTDWSVEAESIHGISRERLETEGVAVATITNEMIDTLSGHDLYASAPSWDGKWMSVLLRAGGRPRHSLRLKKSDQAFSHAARDCLGPAAPEGEVEKLVRQVIQDTEPAFPAHRALPDALLELHRWKRIREEADKRLLRGQ